MSGADARRLGPLLAVAIGVGAMAAGPIAAGAGPQPSDSVAALRDEAIRAMRGAAEYYRQQVAVKGGYVYHYSLDLQRRWGEGEARPQQAWVQPPGTPTVGLAMIAAYQATGDQFYLDAARDAARVLVFGQLRSGGWTNQIDLQRMGEQGWPYEGGQRRRDGNSSLDDGQSQSAMRLLIAVDEALGMRDPAIHDASKRALDALLRVQFPNGGFPQVWSEGPPRAERPGPAMRASLPKYDWRVEGKIKNYWDYCTLNDNVCGYVAQTLLDAHRVYQDDRCLAALRRLGDFLLLAQLPEPQPGWAQQYNDRMQPMWARKFEPPGVSGDESQEVLETLLMIHRATGEEKYLKPFPSALRYLRRSLLPDGRLARYYELGTNRPLYMTRTSRSAYELTYDDSRLPAHYGWKADSKLDDIEARYRRQQAGEFPSPAPSPDPHQVRQWIAQLDDQGRWVTRFTGEPVIGQLKLPVGTPYLSSQMFSDRLTGLSHFVISAGSR